MFKVGDIIEYPIYSLVGEIVNFDRDLDYTVVWKDSKYYSYYSKDYVYMNFRLHTPLAAVLMYRKTNV